MVLLFVVCCLLFIVYCLLFIVVIFILFLIFNLNQGGTCSTSSNECN